MQQTTEEKAELARYMSQHAIISTVALEIVAIILLSGRPPTDQAIDAMVAARARSLDAHQSIRSKIDDMLTMAEMLRSGGATGGNVG